MKETQEFAIVLVTAPDLETARKLVKLALESRLVACGNLVPHLESHYWWQGKMETSSEVLILFKTTVRGLNPLEELIRAHHPYDTPEIIALDLAAGAERYLDWISNSVAGPGLRKL